VNMMGLLLPRPDVIITGPVVAQAGTETVMLVSDHDVGDAVTPLKLMEADPGEGLKLMPVTVTCIP